MPPIRIAANAKPASLVGETELLPGQDWLSRETLLAYATMMQEGRFPWTAMQIEQPLAVDVGTNGKVITQGHHRWVAARLANMAIPIEFEYRTEYVDAGLAVPFAHTWAEVVWGKGRI